MNFYQQKQNFICGPTKTQVDVKKYETTISAKKRLCSKPTVQNIMTICKIYEFYFIYNETRKVLNYDTQAFLF